MVEDRALEGARGEADAPAFQSMGCCIQFKWEDSAAELITAMSISDCQYICLTNVLLRWLPIKNWRLSSFPPLSLRPCMVVGPTGTGKSCYIQDKMMNELDREKYSAFFMAFSAQSTAMQTQVHMPLWEAPLWELSQWKVFPLITLGSEFVSCRIGL